MGGSRRGPREEGARRVEGHTQTQTSSEGERGTYGDAGLREGQVKKGAVQCESREPGRDRKSRTRGRTRRGGEGGRQSARVAVKPQCLGSSARVWWCWYEEEDSGKRGVR